MAGKEKKLTSEEASRIAEGMDGLNKLAPLDDVAEVVARVGEEDTDG